jgi:SAM-dependent methyltransferase
LKYSFLKDVIEWDVYNWSNTLKVWQPIIEKLPKDAKILAVGERNGGMSLWLASLGFKVECTDRHPPSPRAMDLHEGYNLQDNISYRVIDIVHDVLPNEQYDLVILKSVFGGLKEDYKNPETRTSSVRQKALENIYKSLKSGGYILSADNMKGSKFHQFLQKVMNKNSGWHYFSIPEILAFFKLFPSVKIDYSSIIPTSFQNPVLNKLFYFINQNVLFWLPQSSRYISITTARK